MLHAHRSVVGEPPPSWVLAIRGDRFELGYPLSETAAKHLEAALEFFVQNLRHCLVTPVAEPCCEV